MPDQVGYSLANVNAIVAVRSSRLYSAGHEPEYLPFTNVQVEILYGDDTAFEPPSFSLYTCEQATTTHKVTTSRGLSEHADAAGDVHPVSAAASSASTPVHGVSTHQAREASLGQPRLRSLLLQASPPLVASVNLDDQAELLSSSDALGLDSLSAMVTVVFHEDCDAAVAVGGSTGMATCGARLAVSAALGEAAHGRSEPLVVKSVTLGPLSTAAAHTLATSVQQFATTRPVSARVDPVSTATHLCSLGCPSNVSPEQQRVLDLSLSAPLSSAAFTLPAPQATQPNLLPGTLGTTTLWESTTAPPEDSISEDRFARAGSNPYLAILESVSKSCSPAAEDVKTDSRGERGGGPQRIGFVDNMDNDRPVVNHTYSNHGSPASSVSSFASLDVMGRAHHLYSDAGPSSRTSPHRGILRHEAPLRSEALMNSERPQAQWWEGTDSGRQSPASNQDPLGSGWLPSPHQRRPHIGEQRRQPGRRYTQRGLDAHADECSSSADDASIRKGAPYAESYSSAAGAADVDSGHDGNDEEEDIDADDSDCVPPSWFPCAADPAEDLLFRKDKPRDAHFEDGTRPSLLIPSPDCPGGVNGVPAASVAAATAPVPVRAAVSQAANGKAGRTVEPAVAGIAVSKPVPCSAAAIPRVHGGPLSSSGSSSPQDSFLSTGVIASSSGRAGSSVSAVLSTPPVQSAVAKSATVPDSYPAERLTLLAPPPVPISTSFPLSGNAAAQQQRSSCTLNFDEILEPMVTVADVRAGDAPGTPSRKKAALGQDPVEPLVARHTAAEAAESSGVTAGVRAPQAVLAVTPVGAPRSNRKEPTPQAGTPTAFSVVRTGNNEVRSMVGMSSSPGASAAPLPRPSAVAVGAVAVGAEAPLKPRPSTARLIADGVLAAAQRHGPFAASPPVAPHLLPSASSPSQPRDESAGSGSATERASVSEKRSEPGAALHADTGVGAATARSTATSTRESASLSPAANTLKKRYSSFKTGSDPSWSSVREGDEATDKGGEILSMDT